MRTMEPLRTDASLQHSPARKPQELCVATSRKWQPARLAPAIAHDGPLAQLVEQGTLNPKVEGSNPSRPIRTPVVEPNPHGCVCQACQACRDCACGAYLGAYLECGTSGERDRPTRSESKVRASDFGSPRHAKLHDPVVTLGLLLLPLPTVFVEPSSAFGGGFTPFADSTSAVRCLRPSRASSRGVDQGSQDYRIRQCCEVPSPCQRAAVTRRWSIPRSRPSLCPASAAPSS
jgi:hypothetical protein